MNLTKIFCFFLLLNIFDNAKSIQIYLSTDQNLITISHFNSFSELSLAKNYSSPTQTNQSISQIEILPSRQE
ncbi:hypothetical protein BpHYR1_027688 [Brachionus plicatilis]|uniref:Uncharacterized protein n=1 Tax=Brachionus plicatilis TaxID=10195 RepID=A0A3M7QVE8_BRAPC|nr:hypothetical protein BpHYR1_027688 [Brachionus plicatilis]